MIFQESFQATMLFLKYHTALMMTYNASHAVQSPLSVTKATEVSFDVLGDDTEELVKGRLPNVTAVHVANNVCFFGPSWNCAVFFSFYSWVASFSSGVADYANL